MPEQRLEVFEVQQQQAFAISHFKRRVQRRLLAVGQLKQTAQQQRPHFTQGCAQRMARFALDVPQGDRVRLGLIIQPRHAGNALRNFALGIARRAEPTQVALDVGGKHGNPRIAELLSQTLQGDGFTCPRGTRH